MKTVIIFGNTLAIVGLFAFGADSLVVAFGIGLSFGACLPLPLKRFHYEEAN